MGLSIVGPCNTGAHSSYSAFNTFRIELAAAEGFDLDAMVGFGHGRQVGLRPWVSVTSPLVPLLHHSDTDGQLSSDECGQVASRFWQIIREWRRQVDDGDSDRVWLVEYGFDLGEVLLASIKTGRPVIFT